MKRVILALYISTVAAVSTCLGQVDLVDMHMGQKGNSNCVIGPQMPHGSINPSPDTRNGGHDGYREGEPVRGFSQLHVSGTGWGRYGQILLSPQVGFNAEEEGHESAISEEVATPYYYKAMLDRYNILCEFTPSYHSAIYRFTYPKDSLEAGKQCSLLLDVAHNIPQHVAPEIKGAFLGGDIKYDPRDRMIKGYGEYRGGFGDSQTPYRVYFAMFSDNIELQRMQVGMLQSEKTLFARIPVDKENVNIQIAVSMRSIDNAVKYLKAECIGKGFDGVKTACRNAWEKTLAEIEIKAPEADKRVFYTCMYFANVMPRERDDDNPRWLGTNFDDHYCIWDTWRTKYPLMTLLDENFTARTITAFVNRYKNEGCCDPTYTSSLDWEPRQGGDDCVNVIADAFMKDVKGFDRKAAYEYVKQNALARRSPEYQRLGWQPEVGGQMSCSNGLEYAYNDFCAYEIAKKMHDKKFAKQMLARSKSWQHLFNADQKDSGSEITGFITPRREDGTFISIDPRHSFGSWVEYFYEGSTWTYSLFMPHDFSTLINLCGGKEKMTERLQYGFDNDLIQLWNEPGFLSPFVFSECGRPDLTAKYVGMLRRKNFSLDRGFCDNEDSGAMGSWYIFTSIGFFPNAGQDFYYLLAPAYTDVTMHLSSGKDLHITREGDGTVVKAVYLNGKKVKDNMIKHKKLKNGGELKFVM